MKKFILTFIFLISFIIIGYNQNGYTKIFDCIENNCNIDVYFRTELDKIYFDINVDDNITKYKIFFYDKFGRKLIEKDIDCSTTFNKSGITKGLYVIRITDGKNSLAKKIMIG